MDKYKIISGLPMPEQKFGRKKGATKYPFAKMKVGDCFDTLDKNPKASGAQMARRWAKQNGKAWMFAQRYINGTIKVWRIK